jgi:drug/metabolite transporter (DMT)-like permease
MSATALALVAAFTLAGATIYTKRLATAFPHHQLIGPLLLLNSALVAPFGAFVHWHVGWRILALHVASALTLGIGSYCIFDLFAHGSAAAVAVGTAMTPMPALVFSALLLSSPVTRYQAVGATVVTTGVLLALAPAFGVLSRRRAAAMVLIAATTNGLLIVLTKVLSNRGVTLPEIYTVRTALAGSAYLVLIPPRGIPIRGYPRLAIRSSLQTAYFVLLIAAVERGHPATVQTIVATTPLLLLAWSALTERRRPPVRLVAASAAVVVGVALAVS